MTSRRVAVSITCDNLEVIDTKVVEIHGSTNFRDLCQLALGSQSPASEVQNMKVWFELRNRDVAVENPDCDVLQTLKDFPDAQLVKFVVDGATSSVRCLKSRAPVSGNWKQKLLGHGVRLLKLWLTYEAIILLHNTLSPMSPRYRRSRRAQSESDDSEEARDDATFRVLNFLAGGSPEAIEGVEPRRLKAALEALDTEALEELRMPNPKTSSAIIKEILANLDENGQVIVAPEPTKSQPDSNSHAPAAAASSPEPTKS